MIVPISLRPGVLPYGSATLARSHRIAAGSTFTGAWVDSKWASVHSFGFRGNQHGSFFVDAAFVGTMDAFTVTQGTFPGGQGSIRVASYTEAFYAVRPRIIASATGSFSAYYGAQIFKMR